MKHKKTKKRKYKKSIRNKSLKYKRGGAPECNICLEEKQTLIMNPCGHEICEECFKKLKTKICPFCRAQILSLVNPLTNEIVWPKTNPNITPANFIELMHTFYDTFDRRTNWHQWTDIVNSEGNPFYQQFVELFEQLPENKIKSIYKKFRTKPPTIFFKDIADQFKIFEKRRTGVKPIMTKSDNMSSELIIKFLAYTIIIEAPVDNYFDRIKGFFGWEGY